MEEIFRGGPGGGQGPRSWPGNFPRATLCGKLSQVFKISPKGVILTGSLCLCGGQEVPKGLRIPLDSPLFPQRMARGALGPGPVFKGNTQGPGPHGKRPFLGVKRSQKVGDPFVGFGVPTPFPRGYRRGLWGPKTGRQRKRRGEHTLCWCVTGEKSYPPRGVGEHPVRILALFSQKRGRGNSWGRHGATAPLICVGAFGGQAVCTNRGLPARVCFYPGGGPHYTT